MSDPSPRRAGLEVCLPRCTCGHTVAEHEHRNKTKTLPERRTRCLTWDPGPCPCREFRPPADPAVWEPLEVQERLL
jgi:hypothetical protein